MPSEPPCPLNDAWNAFCLTYVLFGWHVECRWNANATVEARIIRIEWNKFRQLVPLLMLHGSETWPVRKENDVALQQTEMRMVGWMFAVKLKHSSK